MSASVRKGVTWGSGKGDDFLLARIDPEDRPRLGKHTWYLFNGYLYTQVDGKTVAMHRMVMDYPEGLTVHHRNGDTLDNRKSNLEAMVKTDHLQMHRRWKKARQERLIADPLLMQIPVPAEAETA